MSRVYESNGPDVKIRGTAAHVAEKYLTLARDASSSGDPVAAENYLQHAEHYSRIVAAANAQQQPQNTGADDRSDDDEIDTNDRFSTPAFLQRPQQNPSNGADRGRQDMNGARHGAEGEGRPPRRERGEPRGEGQQGENEPRDQSPAETAAHEERPAEPASEGGAPVPVQEGAGGEEQEAPRRPRRRGRYRRKDDAEGGETREAGAEGSADSADSAPADSAA